MLAGCLCAEDVCRQLAKVGAALVASLAPAGQANSATNNGSSSTSGRGSSSSAANAPAPQLVALMSLAWQRMSILLTHALRVNDEVSMAFWCLQLPPVAASF
jgi:hypothetical protein